MPKAAFDINIAIQRIEKAVQPFPKAALFELFDEGFTSAFEQLVACIISIRTYDEVTLPTARRLFVQARTAQALSQLNPDEIKAIIRPCTFYENKARQLHTIAQSVHQEYGDVLPCDRDVLLSLPGVGPKCANLVLGLACNQPYIGVDIHVHRVTNRWGYVNSSTPERTILALEAKLPRDYWLEINRLLVPFGKHICTGSRPHCSTCPLLDMCQQAGVQNPQ